MRNAVDFQNFSTKFNGFRTVEFVVVLLLLKFENKKALIY